MTWLERFLGFTFPSKQDMSLFVSFNFIMNFNDTLIYSEVAKLTSYTNWLVTTHGVTISGNQTLTISCQFIELTGEHK
jgi:hypothetical protein